MSTSNNKRPLPEDIFSEGYLEAFYKAHVAPRRSNVDEDIAAIEAEIRKVRRCQSKYRGLLVNDHNLNSCGNSECSDDEDMNMDSSNRSMDSMPTSVFKVYNSSRPYSTTNRSPSHIQGTDVFTWSQYQLVTHDHCYINSSNTTPLDQEGLSLDSINWNHLSLSKRTQALKRLSTILRHRPPSLHYSPTHSSSLSYLPRSVAEFVKSNRGVVTGIKSSSSQVNATTKIASLLLSQDRLISITAAATTPNTTTPPLPPPAHSSSSSHHTPSVTNKTKRKPRPSPYDRVARPLEVTRIRNSSTCSEGEESLEVD